MKVDRIDHLVLTVQDVEKACESYPRVLGMEVILLENHRKALRFCEAVPDTFFFQPFEFVQAEE